MWIHEAYQARGVLSAHVLQELRAFLSPFTTRRLV
jgi:hypothetical protein